ncbi:UBA-like protein [Lyophyllum atratum]|nr:UBA-like protein [Lyophyllum atratum]
MSPSFFVRPFFPERGITPLDGRDIPVVLPSDDVLEFGEPHLGRGLQASETELPHEAPAAAALPEFNAAALAQLEGMGFPMIRCHKALLATGNSDAEAAMEWLFAHMEDPGASLLLASSFLHGSVTHEGF